MTQPLTDEVKLAVLTLITEVKLDVKWWKGSPNSPLSWVRVTEGEISANEDYDPEVEGEDVKALARAVLTVAKALQ